MQQSKLDSLISQRDRLQEQIAELVAEERNKLRKQIRALDHYHAQKKAAAKK